MKKRYLNKWLYLVPFFDYLICLALISSLPDRIPTHFDINWVADGYGSKWTILMFPTLLLGQLLLAEVLPKIDPLGKNYSRFDKTYKMVHIILMILFIGIQTICIMQSLEINVVSFMPIYMGLLFVVLGNFFPKVKANYFLGIKTPWALNDEENWNYTHRLGGRVWFVGGLFTMLLIFVPKEIQSKLMFILVMAMALIPFVYSYLFFRKKKEVEKNVGN